MFSVTLTWAPPLMFTVPVWPEALPICRPEVPFATLAGPPVPFGWVRASVPAVTLTVPFWTLSWLKLLEPLLDIVSAPAPVLVQLKPPPLSLTVLLRVRVPAPPLDVRFAPRVMAELIVTLPVLRVIVGLVPMKLSG